MTYVLITPARNEGYYIENTIRSVVSQTLLPQKWIIVSDDSTDQTDDIVMQYAAKHDFIKFVRTETRKDREYGSMAKAVAVGYRQLRKLQFNVIGKIDADSSV